VGGGKGKKTHSGKNKKGNLDGHLHEQGGEMLCPAGYFIEYYGGNKARCGLFLALFLGTAGREEGKIGWGCGLYLCGFGLGFVWFDG